MKVSIIIPCHNCQTYVSRAIESALKQEVEGGVEILLIDNNSTDGTLGVLKSYVVNYENVFLYQELKKGAPAARNRGLREAKGEWLQFLDADDELERCKIQEQLSQVGEKEAVVIGSYTKIKGHDNKLLRLSRPDRDIWISLIKSDMGITSSNLFRKDVVDNIGGWNEQLTSSQEYDLMFRIIKQRTSISFDRKPNTLIYFNPNSVSQSLDLDKIFTISCNAIELRLRIKSHLTRNNLLTNHRKVAINKYIYALMLRYGESLPQLCYKYKSEILGMSLNSKLSAYFGYISWYVYMNSSGKMRFMKMLYFGILKINRLFL